MTDYRFRFASQADAAAALGMALKCDITREDDGTLRHAHADEWAIDWDVYIDPKALGYHVNVRLLGSEHQAELDKLVPTYGVNPATPAREWAS